MYDVACVLVNYNSGRLCASAVQSLQAQRFRGRDGGPGRLQVVVVDNASPEAQRAHLDPLAGPDVEVCYRTENDGYSGGVNHGVARVDAEFVLIANPDILVLPGALQALVERLRSDPSLGLVGPRGYLDWGRQVLLPPNDLPSLWLHVQESVGRVHRSVARNVAARRSRRYRRAWRAAGPFAVTMISGYAMLLRAALARRLGPFDPRFPFYFEDADLCRRVAGLGLGLAIVPAAEVIHFFDQSARSARAEVARKYDISRAWYYAKHYGRLGAWLFGRLNRYVAAARGHLPERHVAGIRDLGGVADPPRLEFDCGGGPFVVEIATDPTFLFCGGSLGRGDSFTFGASAWDALETTRWFLRVLRERDLALLHAVTFQKTRSPAAPVDYATFLERAGLVGAAP